MSAKKTRAHQRGLTFVTTGALQQLAELGELYKTGQLKGTKYHLAGPDGLKL